MTVDHRKGNYQYPIVADPKYTWGWVTGTIYFDNEETKNLRSVSQAAAIVGTLCAPLGFACVVGAGWAQAVANQASNAVAEGRCVKLKVPTLEPGTYPAGQHVCK